MMSLSSRGGSGVQLPGFGEELEMDLPKETLEPQWVMVQITPAASVRAVSLEDTVGLKARAWHDRFVIRDIIDLHAVAGTFSYSDLENLARRHDPHRRNPDSFLKDRGADCSLRTRHHAAHIREVRDIGDECNDVAADEDRSGGYRVTEHVLGYYRTTRV